MSVIYFAGVRANFPSLTAALVSKKFPDSKPMFGIDLIDIDPQSPVVKQFMQAYAEIAQKEWGANANAVMQMIQSDRRSRCFGMGAEKVREEDLKPLAGYNQGFWVRAKNKEQPQMIRPDGQPAQTAMEAMDLARKIYSGCYVNAAIRIWPRKTNRGIGADLIAVQFAKDGEALGDMAIDVTPMFGAVVGAASNPFAPQAPAAPVMPGLPSFM